MAHAVERRGDEVVLRITGALDALTVPDIRSTIDELALQAPPVVVVDLSGLILIDSSGVGALVSLYKRVRAAGGELALEGVRDQPMAVLRLLRLDQLLVRDGV